MKSHQKRVYLEKEQYTPTQCYILQCVSFNAVLVKIDDELPRFYAEHAKRFSPCQTSLAVA